MQKISIGKNPKIGEYVSLGEEPPDMNEKLMIGDNTVIRSHSVVYGGTKIGDNFQTGHGVLIRENNIIGNNVSVGSHTVIEKSNYIEDEVRIHSNCFIPEFVKIEKKAWIGPNVVILNILHPPCPRFEDCAKGIIIKKNAKIGGNVTIGPRVTIGENCLIGFGSVVTEDVPDNSVAVGNPAKVIKSTGDLKCVTGWFKKPYEWEEEE